MRSDLIKLGIVGCRYAWLRESDPWKANMYHSAMMVCIEQSEGDKP